MAYYKFNQENPSNTLWNARNDVNYCAGKVLYLTAKLAKLGWECNAVYQPSPTNKVSQTTITVNKDTNADLPNSPLEFKRFLQTQFEVDFQTTADYHIGKDNESCIAKHCKEFVEHLGQYDRSTQSLFGYKVSNTTALCVAPQCRGRHCWGDIFQQAEKIEPLPLPGFATDRPKSLFLTSQNQGFPDLWLPVAHNSATIHEVKILRYRDDGYETLAHLLAKSAAGKQSGVPLESGTVTLTAGFETDESLELVYQTGDIRNEALLFNPGSY